MAWLKNGFEAGSNGNTITTSGSGDPDALISVGLGGGGTAVYSSAQKAHGSLSALLTATTSGDSAVLGFGYVAAGTVTVSLSMRWAAYPSANMTLIKLRNNSGNAAAVIMKSDGKLVVTNAAGTWLKAFTSAVGTGAWIRVELTATKGTTTSNGRIQAAYYSGDSTTATDSYDSGAAVNAGTTDLTLTQVGLLETSGVTGSVYLDSLQLAEQALPLGAWTDPPLDQSITEESGSTDAGYTLYRGISLTITDDAGTDDDVTPDEGVVAASPPAGGGQDAVLDSAVLGGGLVWLYGLQESQGSTVAGDVSGAPGRPLLRLTAATEVGTAEFGAAGIMPEGTALALAPAIPDGSTTVTGRQLVGSDVSAYLGTEFALLCVFAWTGTSVRLLQLGATGGPMLVLQATASQVTARLTTTAGTVRTVTVTTATGDNRPHAAVLTAAGNVLTLVVDSAEQSATTMPADMGRVTGLTIGGLTSTAPHQIAWVGYLNCSLTLAEAADLANLASGGSERSDERVARVCRWLGVDPDLVADTGLSDVAYQATGGAQALDVLNEAMRVEDGVVFPAGDGRLVMHSRARRYAAPVRLTLTASQVSPDLAVQVDLTRVVNDMTVSRPAGATSRARNEASIAAYGPRTEQRTIWAATDDDVAQAALWRVLRYGEPAPRIPEVTVDLLPLTAQEATALLSLEIGDRIQVTGMPSTTPGGTVVDLFVEGVSDAMSATEWRLTLATSPYYEVLPGLLDTAELDDLVLAY